MTDLPHLKALGGIASVERLRAGLVGRYPAFAQAPKNVGLVGAAVEGERFLTHCRALGIAVRGVCDSNAKKVGTQIEGHTVLPMAAADSWETDVPIVVASHLFVDAVENLVAGGKRSVVPLALLQVMLPGQFHPHMFYDGLLEDLFASRDQYSWLAERLSDPVSKATLDAVVGFRMSFDTALLGSVVREPDWAYLAPDLVRFDDDGVYIDGGAYTGDTVRRYIAACRGKFARILAFEPDPATFGRLSANFADDKRIEPMPYGLHRRTATLRFLNDGSRAALLSDEGKIEIPVISIDEVLNGDSVSYIKLNIEGAEIETLKGAEELIARWRPTLAIAAYHSPKDLWAIARLISKRHPGYRLHLRQHDGGSVETVLYAVDASRQ